MLNILLAQINPVVGDIAHNTQLIIDTIKAHAATHDLIVFPELAIVGYPPEDLLFYPSFINKAQEAVAEIAKFTKDVTVVTGCLDLENGQLFNSAAIIQHGRINYYHKQSLPNYGVFDEQRYFQAGQNKAIVFEHKNQRFGVLICEDIWQSQSLQSIENQDIGTLIVINASPYEQDKLNQRIDILKQIASQGMHILYLNQTGAQDELIFDGQSLVMDSQMGLIYKAKAFQQEYVSLTLDKQGLKTSETSIYLPKSEEIYEALCLGLRDFLKKNKINKVVLGLSGGIDSALCLAIAADSLGASHVHALIMPSKYSAEMSAVDAIAEAKALNVAYTIQPINCLVDAFDKTTTTHKNPLTQQNIQARIRGMLLMAYANEHQAMVISTSNKSEAAVGYCTLYGDMCGGLAILKDVYKTEIYDLCRYRNSINPVIPENVITRPPSAELAPNQKDADDLPPYDVLDALLYQIIEKRACKKELLALGYSEDLIHKIQTRLKSSEFKRVQAAPGLKISKVGFNKDWRMPISNQWSDY